MNRSQPRAVKWITFQTQTPTVCRLPNIHKMRHHRLKICSYFICAYVYCLLFVFLMLNASPFKVQRYVVLTWLDFYSFVNIVLILVLVVFVLPSSTLQTMIVIRTAKTRIYASLLDLWVLMLRSFSIVTKMMLLLFNISYTCLLLRFPTIISQSVDLLYRSIVKTKYMIDYHYHKYCQYLARNLYNHSKCVHLIKPVRFACLLTNSDNLISILCIRNCKIKVFLINRCHSIPP